MGGNVSTSEVVDGRLQPTSNTSIVLTVVFIIAVVLLVIAITYFLYSFKQYSDCNNEPNYWCFNDWTCNTPSPDDKDIHPAKYLYCNPGSTPTNFGYCLDPANANQPACMCNIARTQTCIPKECTCQWNNSGSGPIGPCGGKFCSPANTQLCDAGV